MESKASTIHSSDGQGNVTGTIRMGSFVTLHYKVTGIHDGQERVLLNTFEDRPATVEVGSGQFAPGLERCLIALREGERRSYDLASGDAFGPRNPELIQSVARSLLTEHARPDDPLEPGDLLEFPTPDGGRFAGVFKEWQGDSALFDFNHPLAGQAVRFEVQIIGVL